MMQTNTRFAVAIHVLALARVAYEELGGTPITSERLAASVNTNPVFVRRVLGALRESGLVTSQPGPGGGWRLTRPPSEITLGEVYRSVQAEPLFAMPHREPDPSCPVGSRMPPVLVRCFQEAEAALEHRLDRTTIADVIDSVVGSMCGSPQPPLAHADAAAQMGSRPDIGI